MEQTAVLETSDSRALSDQEVIARVLAGETALYEIIMRRYNQRLYRAVRSVLRDEDEVEDVMQDAYVRAYRHLADFEGRSLFSTWLLRIALHEAFARKRRSNRLQPLNENPEGVDMLPATTIDPEQQASRGELAHLLESTISGLPEQFRTVIMLRDIEELSTAETAAALNISEENVKTRLHRGRAMVRRTLFEKVGSDAPQAFVFMGARCDRVVGRVMELLEIPD
ncbi:MAG: RNA polymerase sigma factor [Acidobacteria bacterium]|nr:RNA polymerase sigma factor [Acidobacteriota bacterium]MBV9147395.1 RNA polymerase sigma factor [Acidobacteriota bacterium]MBV9436514.1 RNA polymerase sigma factor [Acidobacteriota bacterium]